MSVHLLILRRVEADFPDKIIAAFPQQYYKIAADVWALKSNHTAKEISEILFPPPHSQKLHIVIQVSTGWWGYYGRDFWEWIDAASK
jgi:hypothetical protein